MYKNNKAIPPSRFSVLPVDRSLDSDSDADEGIVPVILLNEMSLNKKNRPLENVRKRRKANTH